MLKKHEPPLWVKAGPSKRLKRITGILRALALAACLSNALPIELKGILCAITYGCFTHSIKRLKNRQYTIKYSEAQAWEFAMDNDDLESVRILPSSVVTQYALFLHVEIQPKNSVHQWSLNGKNKKTALIMADALNIDEYRRLIVKLTTTTIKQKQAF